MLRWLFIQLWRDELLQWDPNEYGGLQSLTVTNDVIWTPEIVTVNSVNGGVDMTLAAKFRSAN